MVNTKHIDKNGLSFDCPDYYDIGNFPSSDGVYKSMVALSNQNRECELYVMVYRESAFDYNAIRNYKLLEAYLKLQNYYNITSSPHVPYTFKANIDYGEITVKTTIAYNFNHRDVIMVVGNVMPFSNYKCDEDIKIIINTVRYKEVIMVDAARSNVSVICYECGFGYNTKLHNSCPNCGCTIGLFEKK